MIYLFKFIASLILPPTCIIILLIVSLVIQYKRKKQISKLVLIAAVLLYVFSIPLTANLLIHPLEYSFSPPAKLSGDVIVMLGGGATLDSPDISGVGNLSSASASRLLTVARLYKKEKLPIIISGGQVYKTSGVEADLSKRQLLDLGFNESDIIAENESRNTTENAEFTKKLLNKYGYSKPILVTSAFHMKRALMNFTNAGVKDVIPYPTDYYTNKRLTLSYTFFIPSNDGFNTTVIALHEYLGIFQLWIKELF